MSRRWALLGLASIRAPWFRQTTGWAMSGVVPIDFEKCVSTADLVTQLRSGRTYSAALVDGGLPELDRDLFREARERGVAVFVVGPPTSGRDWAGLGAHAVLDPDFSRHDLADLLATHAQPIHQQRSVAPRRVANRSDSGITSGKLVAVIGRTGSGVSTTAIALAQGLAHDMSLGERVVLADLARRADHALLHDAHDVVPGLQELVEAHRIDNPTVETVRSMTFDISARGYDLLLGLRRPRDWATMRRASFGASIESLRHAYQVTVADLDDDLEGDEDGGSSDIAERNLASRATLTAADVVLAVGTPTLVGIRSLVLLIDELLALGVAAERVQPVISQSNLRARERSDLARTVAELVHGDGRLALATPIHLPQRRGLDDVHRNGTRLPLALVTPLVGATIAAFRRPIEAQKQPGPEPVVPGSLGTLDERGDAA